MEEILIGEIQESDLVMVRQPTNYGYSNTWWRVLFIDNDGSFVGKLERCHWLEYETHKKGDCERFDLTEVKRIYNKGEKFCYGDNITICNCEGLCKEK